MKNLIGKPIRSTQYFTLSILIGYILLCLIWYLISENENILMILLLSIVLSIAVFYFQSKIYEINSDKGLIFIRNISHKSIYKSLNDFKSINKYLPLAGLFYIYFNDGSRYLFLVDGKIANKTIFGDIRKIEEELCQKLREQLNDDPLG